MTPPVTAEPAVEQVAATSNEGKVLSADPPQEPSTANGHAPTPAEDVPVEAPVAESSAADGSAAEVTVDEAAQDAAKAEVQSEQGKDPDIMGEQAPVNAHVPPKQTSITLSPVTPVIAEQAVAEDSAAEPSAADGPAAEATADKEIEHQADASVEKILPTTQDDSLVTTENDFEQPAPVSKDSSAAAAAAPSPTTADKKTATSWWRRARG